MNNTHEELVKRAKLANGSMDNTVSPQTQIRMQRDIIRDLLTRNAELESENKGLRDRVLEEAAVICEGWRIVNGKTAADTLRGMKEKSK